MKILRERSLRETRTLGRRLCTGALMTAIVLANCACSPPVHIKEVSLLRKTPTSAQYQVICVNDDSKGTVFVRAVAETVDHQRTTLYQPVKAQSNDPASGTRCVRCRADGYRDLHHREYRH
jgi:hypothetical protein